MSEPTVQELESEYKALVVRRDAIASGILNVTAEYEARKRALKEKIAECRKAGLNPDTLDEDIKKMRETLAVKNQIFKSDIEAAEKKLAPMLKEIEG